MYCYSSKENEVEIEASTLTPSRLERVVSQVEHMTDQNAHAEVLVFLVDELVKFKNKKLSQAAHAINDLINYFGYASSDTMGLEDIIRQRVLAAIGSYYGDDVQQAIHDAM